MRWTQTFIPTLKETPAEAEIVSHQLLLRAGLVRKLTGGLYTFLPMGLRALRKVERIIREEMDRAGAIEVLMPALQPPDIWQQSGRYVSARDVLYKVRDRANKEWLLGPTHEEVITTLVANEFSSYRQLPRNFYQIQTKFRDEIRPRFGLMRAKEFIMKDAYSFDSTDEAAQASYQAMYDAYTRIFRRCGLRALPVEADTGVIGGKFSHEFMVPADTGENEVVYCESGQYAANIEKAASQGPLVPLPCTDTGPAPEPFPTPGVLTIDALSQPPYGVRPEGQIKTLVYLVESRLVLLLLRGDDTLNEAKLTGFLGTNQFRAAEADEIAAVLGARPGSLGAVHTTLRGPAAELPVYADLALRGGAGMTTGANRDGFHLRHVNLQRDIQVARWADLRTVAPGELCTVTARPLKVQRAIEVGHVFKLGTKYSEKLNALFLDESGRQHPCIMGCYGIGVTRTVQAIIEQCHDKDGILWPVSVAPCEVCITPLSVQPDNPCMQTAERLYAGLTARGVDVILDDRDDRPGVKFKDADLIGFPLRVGLGEKSMARGEVELKPRGGSMTAVKAEEALDRILAWRQAALEANSPAS
ncbi:MAG TPA: proline--tRNA ligase [Verrucomicrobiota bacterium]|nr:proline--tRNA ligase [Verrucomicrobiota bacterium]HNU50923.1 proline--tRNA ligase [Verrucomicrobiota bacterium]